MVDQAFLGCLSREIQAERCVLLGCPLDMTATFRTGCAQAPAAIRAVSDSIETYSPLLDRDLEDFPFSDLGDLRLPDSLELSLNSINQAVSEILSRNSSPLCLGGEHTITWPIFQAVERHFPEVIVIHLDAHTDLRDEYNGSTMNHATVMKRVSEITGPKRLIQLGIRSGTKEEFHWMRENQTFLQWAPGADEELLDRVRDRPVYLTLDLDVLDPACMPGTGNPEAGGWFYYEMEPFFLMLDGMNLVGADVVELNPGLDPAQTSTITAAKIVRELLLILGKRNG
jgi:agmatinase